jgi:hypothetical protein
LWEENRSRFYFWLPCSCNELKANQRPGLVYLEPGEILLIHAIRLLY